MNKKITQYVSIIVIIVCAGILGYTFLKPGGQTNQNTSGLVPIVDGKQVVAMTVKAANYSPNYFKVKAGVPVRWEITSSGQPGCASGEIIANGITGPIYLNPQQGQVKIVEFTPQTPGTYKFNCAMNMARGTIEVVN